MTRWIESGRSEVLEAVTAALNRIDQRVTSDFENIKKELESALQERDKCASETEKLRNDNARLRETLRTSSVPKVNAGTVNSAQHEERQKGTISASAPGLYDANASSEEPDWKKECSRVSLKFNALSDNFKKAKDALRKRKDERDRWHDHALILEKRIKAAEEQHGIHIIGTNKALSAAIQSGLNPNAAPHVFSTSFTSDAGLEQADLELPPLAATSLSQERRGNPETSKAVNPQSESTEGETQSRHSDDLPETITETTQDDPFIKQEPSSDGPVVVSERVVQKRKRGDDGVRDSPPRKVKVELPDSSSPIHAVQSDSLESLDLGEVTHRISTPRKRKDWGPEENLRSGAFNTTTTPVPPFVRPDSNAPQTARPFAQRTSVLTPLSVNRRVAKSGSDKPVGKLRRGLSEGIAALAEDGSTFKRNQEVKTRSGSNAGTVSRGRLDALLNSPSARDDTAVPALGRTRGRAVPDDLNIPGRRELPFEKGGRQKENQTSIQPESVNRAKPVQARVQASDTRSPLAHKQNLASLRNKPISELRPEDFKVNPKVNDGHDFAFSEVVRDGGGRACLQGCTDMHCCGKQFRALALSQKPNPPLTGAQRMEETKLLESYLGDLSYRLAGMDRAERDELWVEAKTAELANKYGRHRHRFSRMQSPPGFWNADFPETQELEAERAEASKRERQAVQERYREAMRPGGRWLFRDE